MKTRHFKTGDALRVKLTAAASGMTVLSAVVAAALLQPSIASAIQDGKGLAELAGRSPGKRIGGIALKGKKPKAGAVRTARGTRRARGSQAMVLASAVVPEGPIPGYLPGEEVPTDFNAPDIPIEALPQVADFGGGPALPGGSLFFFGPFPVGPGAAPPPAVPEPSTWLMLIAGFGILGWSVRRKRNGAAAAV